MRGRPKAIDLFCGVGGLSLGFESAGFDVVGAFDLDPINIRYYRTNHSTNCVAKLDLSKATGIRILEMAGMRRGELDVLFGGPPCQGFSLIGRRDTRDPRNLLLLDFARLVREILPRYFVMENVSGLLAGAARATLDRFLEEIALVGYRVVEPLTILEASDFGVPQRRPRLFVLGYREDLAPPQYPVGGSSAATRDALFDLPTIDDDPSLLAGQDAACGRARRGWYSRHLLATFPPPYVTPAALRYVTGCARTRHTHATVARFRSTVPGTVEPVSRAYRLHPRGISPTLRAGTGPDRGSFTAARPIHPMYPRYVTTREAARLHSYPDWFQFHPTKWHALRQIGNSVPPLLARAVALSIRHLLTAR